MESNDSVHTFLQFYESIPDYGDLNHLSDREFYLKLQQLKTKQKHYLKDLYECNNGDFACRSVKNKQTVCEEINKHSKSPISYSKYNQPSFDICGRKCYLNDKASYAMSEFKPLLKKASYSSENIVLEDKLEKKGMLCSPVVLEDTTKNGSGSLHLKFLNSTTNFTSDNEDQENKLTVTSNDKSKNKHYTLNTQQENIKSQRNKKLINKKYNDIPSASKHIAADNCSSIVDSMWDGFSIEDYIPKTELCSESDSGRDEILDLPLSYSVPNSPALKHNKSVGWRTPKLTVLKPFKMTLREEEEKHLNAVRYQLLRESNMTDEPKEEMNKIKANPIPLESRVPLFDKIMAEQEIRRRQVKQQCINKLKSQMKPFKFVKRDEDRARWHLCYSSPDLRNTNASSPKPKSFRARPVPKNLFSADAYRRLCEDEFYRALKKKVRAEEMLRSSSLPPSMAAREKVKKAKALSSEVLNSASNKKRKKLRVSHCGKRHDIVMRELEDQMNENATIPQPFKLKMAEKQQAKSARFLSPDNSSISSRYEMYASPTPTDTIYTRSHSALGIPLNRNNLASVLRMQTARQRIENELAVKQEEIRRKEQAKQKACVTRCKPAWQALNYSTEEDLEIRVQTRRAEERIRREEYERYMELMYDRVERIPTLFERQSQISQRPREKHFKTSRGRMGHDIRVASVRTTPDLYEEEEAEIEDVAERSDISEDKGSKMAMKASISETPETIECSSEHGYEGYKTAREEEKTRLKEEKVSNTEETKEYISVEEKEKDENESLESIEEEISRKSDEREHTT